MRARLATALAAPSLFVLLAGLVAIDDGPSRAAGTYDRHAVAADHPLASQAGLEVLEDGGNAADAAAATMLALGVVSPASSGLGGGGFALYYRASDRSLTFLDFRETAPAAASATMFARREGDDDTTAATRSQTGGLAVAVPGEPAGIDALITRFGSRAVTRAEIAAPAERFARGGFPASRYVSDESATVIDAMRTDPLLTSWLDGDRIPRGRRITNPALAATIRTFGRQGARPFYRGAIAQEIVRAVAARGGVITAEDLAGYEVRERAPLRAERFGRTWVTAPPPSAGGYTLLHALALLERWTPEGGWRDDAALRHALTQSWIGPFSDRAAYFGDPDHTELGIDRLLADERIAARAERFDPERARPIAEWAAPPGTGGEAPRDAGTSHVCVVDADGNVAAVTTTINLQFGARVSAAGILLNDEMDDFAREVGAPNYFGLPGGAANLPAPGRRPVSTMTPTIVLEDGTPALCVGGSGGSRIVTATMQVALFALLFDQPVQDAIARPRVHAQGAPAETWHEPGIDPAWLLSLWRRGHDLDERPTLANVQAIRIVRRDGRVIELQAGSDPRKDGQPAGR